MVRNDVRFKDVKIHAAGKITLFKLLLQNIVNIWMDISLKGPKWQVLTLSDIILAK